MLTGPTTIPTGRTLTIGAGNILKFGTYWGNYLQVNGSLVVSGTSTSPVVLTSPRDDTAGGDTNADGNSTTPAPGNWGGITVQGTTSSVSINYADIRYPSSGVSSSGAASAVVKNSTIQQSSGVGISVYDSGWPSPTNQLASAVITNNRIVNSGSIPIQIYNYSQGLNLTLANLSGNNGSGNAGGNELDLYGWALTQDETWGFGAGSFQTVLTGPTTIPTGRTLTIGAGNILKFGTYWGNYLQVNGSLVVSGTSTSPVVLTSLRDDTAGGDTNADGNSTTPAPGNWGGITVQGGGSALLNGATLRYASTALTVADQAAAEFHGSVVTSSFGIAGGEGYVDATGVDWGSPSGPAPIGSGVGFSGSGVNVTPWVGYVAPTPLPGDPYTAPTVNPCASVLFVGVRGSSESPQGDPPIFADPDQGNSDDGLGSRVRDVYTGFKNEISAYSPSTTVKSFGLQYRALGVLYNPFNRGSLAYFTSIYEGVDQLTSLLFDETQKCPSEKIVLSGYSQGALVIHIVLRNIAKADSSIFSHLGAVALIADPAKVPNGSEFTLEESGKVAGSGVRGAEGIWTMFPLDSDVGPIPTAISSRTIAMCRNHDPVCAPPSPGLLAVGLLAFVSVHTDGYYEQNTDVLGRWAADKYLGRQFDLGAN